MHAACKIGNIDLVKFILSAKKIDFKSRNVLKL